MLKELKKNYNLVPFIVLFLWAGVVIFVASHHEMWRDEAHCLYVALSADSLWQLPHAVKNEGHPVLWYLLLWVGYNLSGSPFVLQLISLVIGFIGVFLFYRFSPFSTWFKLLFVFSFLPLYEYSVMARNYGISMLFFFLYAALYPYKKERPYLLAFALFFLANTNIHSAIFVCFLTLFWGFEEFFAGKMNSSGKGNGKMLFLPLFIAVLGVVMAAITVIPDQNSIVMQTSTVSVSRLLDAFLQTVIQPGSGFNELFVGLPAVGRDLLIWVLAAGLLVKPTAALLLFGGAIALGTFFSIGYSGALRHQGIFFLYVLTLYWITFVDIKDRGRLVSLFKRRLFKVVLYGAISSVLFVHLVGSYKYIVRDVTKEMSSNKSFGLFLKEHEVYHDAIIMGEPDIRLESLPYYVDNPIFVPRINRYEKFIKLTWENKKEISLAELLTQAKKIRKEEGKTVLIALGHFDLSGQAPPYVRVEQYGRLFTWTPQQLREFKANTIKIAEFKEDVKNEQYELYQLK